MTRQFAMAASLLLACAGVGTSAPVPRAPAPDPMGPACMGCEFDTLAVRVPGQGGVPEGLSITSVYGGSAARRAGLQAGDVITKFNGIEFTGQKAAIFYDLKRELGTLRPGATVPVTIERNGETLTLRVRLSDTMGTPPERPAVVEEP